MYIGNPLDWIALILYALDGRGGPANPTDDFVEYMTSNAFLVHAEADKIKGEAEAFTRRVESSRSLVESRRSRRTATS